MAPKSLPFRVCDGVSLADGLDDSNTGWHQVAVLGSWKGHHQGAFSIGPDTLQQMADGQSSKAIPTVVDYNHASVMDREAPAAGWLTHAEIRPGTDGQQGLWGRIEWTQRAADKIRAKEYRFLSPTIRWQTTDRKTGKMGGASLHSVALTNTPFLHELPEVRLNSLTAALFGHPNGGTMNPELHEKLAGLLGLAEDAEPEQLLTAGEKLTALAAKARELLALADTTPEALEAAVVALQTAATSAVGQTERIAALEAKLAEVEARDQEAAAVALVRTYQAQRKVAGDGTPNFAAALKHARSDAESFRALMESMQPWVPSAEPLRHEEPSPERSLTEHQKKLAADLGLTVDQYIKYSSTL